RGPAVGFRVVHEEDLFVGLQYLLPAQLPDYYSPCQLLRLGQKFAERDRNRRAGKIAVRSFVNAIDEEASLLKFNREVEGSRDVDALDFNAPRVPAAGRDLARPECETTGIRLAIEKINIVLI